MITAGRLRLRYWRRLSERRKSVLAVVVAARQTELVLRLPTGDGAEAEGVVSVAPAVAAQWQTLLERGGPVVEEPDFEDPHGWDGLLVSYCPEDPRPIMTSQQVEDARTQPMLLVAMGALISAMVLLCMVPAVLLCLLGSIAAVVAVSLAFGTGRTALRRFRRPASSRGDRALQGILGLGCAALFVGTGAVAMIVAGLTWRR